jgi:hypothetical protein
LGLDLEGSVIIFLWMVPSLFYFHKVPMKLIIKLLSIDFMNVKVSSDSGVVYSSYFWNHRDTVEECLILAANCGGENPCGEIGEIHD